MVKKYITKSYKQTQKLGKNLAKEVLALRDSKGAPHGENNSAVVFGLQGNLGGGKTTFLQGFAKGLGIKEKILSPTFVILKHFKIPIYNIQNTTYTDFYHIDCYRLKNEKDILELDFKEIIFNPKNIVAVEWPEKIKKALPKNTGFISFKFIDKNTRELELKI